MQTLITSLKILLVTIALLFSGICSGQERTTKEAKIILAVNTKTDAIEHIELLANFQEMEKDKLVDKYSQHNFFLGLLKGNYSLNENWIIPGKNTTVIIYTDKQFSPLEDFFHGDNLSTGDEFSLGKTKAKVITNNKGELMLKTQNP